MVTAHMSLEGGGGGGVHYTCMHFLYTTCKDVKCTVLYAGSTKYYVINTLCFVSSPQKWPLALIAIGMTACVFIPPVDLLVCVQY